MNFDEVCRTCLSTDGIKRSIFDSAVDEFDSSLKISVVDLFKSFTKLEMCLSDDFPTQICTECLEEIQRAYCFMLKCERSEEILRKIKNSETLEKDIHLNISKIKIEHHDKENEVNCTINPLENADSAPDNRNRLETTVKQFELEHNSLTKRRNTKLEEIEIDNFKKDLSSIGQIKEEPELDIPAIEKDFSDNIFDEDSTSSEIFRCPGCSYVGLTREILGKHIIGDHMNGKICKLCDKEFQCSSIQHCFRHLPIHSESDIVEKPDFQCSICSKIFATKSEYDKHAKTYKKLRPYKCNMCSKNYSCRSTLNRHKRWNHADKTKFVRSRTEETPFRCEVCLKSYSCKSALGIHTRLKHISNPCNLKCEICLKSFAFKSHFSAHMRSHSGERPFKCENCTKEFRYYNSLKIHMKVVHSFDIETQKPYENPFKCEICEKTFQYQRNVKSHMKIMHSVGKKL